MFSDTSYTNYKHMETLKGIFQCPQKLTNVIQTSQNSPWLSLRSLNKWYGVFAPQYYKFSHNACSTECAFRQRSRENGVVHDKGDGCKCETTLECTSAWLCLWCKDITVIRFVTDTNSTKGAALRKHSSAALDTSRGSHFSQHVAPLEGPIFKT